MQKCLCRPHPNNSQEASAAAAVFQALAHAALQDAAAGVHDDEAEGEAADDGGVGAMAEREEWFARAAAVGRAAAGQSAAFLAQHIGEKQQVLQQCATTGAHLLGICSEYHHPNFHALPKPVDHLGCTRWGCSAGRYCL